MKLFWVNLLSSFLLISNTSAWGNDKVKTFIEALNEEDQIALDRFLRLMVQTINGFVIYGDKPLGLVSYVNETVLLPSEHKNANVFPKGKNLWHRLNISPFSKEYSFAIFNSNGYCNFVAINRKQFIKTVNENLSLFRYVLGPTLTAENLLQALLNAGDNFYDIIKNDNVLFGILLGYGTQNSLLVSRSEFLCCSTLTSQKEVFPFLPYLIRQQRKGGGDNQQRKPSFGYATISEEIEALEKKTISSHDNPPLTPYALPYFGCETNSEETQNLIAAYEKNQKEILKAVDDPNFIENTLTKFLTTASGEIEIPSSPIESSSLCLESKEDLSDKLADLLAIDVAYEEKRERDLCLKSYLQGIEFEHEQKEIKSNRYHPNWSESYEVEEELTRSINLKQSEAFFSRLAQSEKLVCLIPNGIYYKTLRKGKGEPVSSKINQASFHYSVRLHGKKETYSIGTIQKEHPELFISGVIHALIGMKRGEERVVAIHPKYGYGDTSFFCPNSTLIVTIQLLDFQEGDQEIAISPPYDLKMKNIEEMVTRSNELKSEKYYEKGRQLWRTLSRSRDSVDLPILRKAFEGILKGERKCPFKTIEDAHDYSIRLRESLLSNKKPDLKTGQSSVEEINHRDKYHRE